MRHKLETTLVVISLLMTALIPWSTAAGQAAAPPSLEEQLRAQYKTVKMGSDSNGPRVLDEGTVLAIQKGGILGVPWTVRKACASKYEDSTLKPPSGFCSERKDRAAKRPVTALRGIVPGLGANDPNAPTSTRYFNKGEKVYPLNISVDLKNERISFAVVACDSCNKTDPPTHYKSEVQFQFAAGYLEKPDVSKIEDTIGEVLAIDASTPETEAQQSSGQGDQAQAQQQSPSAQAAQSAPPQIQMGQSIDQVVATLGQPEKTVDLGAKKIYLYKDLKVTFMNAKVADVQ